MEKWPKEKLISEIGKLEEKLKLYQTKLRDLVTAYKSLVTEKEALESSVKALQNVQNLSEGQFAENQSDISADDASDSASCDTSAKSTGEPQAESFHAKLTTLMNSLATLSAEKCRMEASFQADKKLLRQEKDKNESLIKELQEKLKKITVDATKEIEQLKSKLIIVKHEREKDQNDNAVMMRELQKLLSQEREEKLTLEKNLSELTPKFQLLVNKEETERFKETDMSEKFVHLQKKHLDMVESERKRTMQTEQESKEQIAMHEQRVASLETRLTELSHTVANYHRLRQQDQNEITKLKAQIVDMRNQKSTVDCEVGHELDLLKSGTEVERTAYVRSLIDKLLKYKNLLLNANEYLDKPVELHSVLCDNRHSYEMQSVSLEVHRKLMSDYDALMQKLADTAKNKNEIDSLNIKIQVLLDQNSVLNNQVEETVRNYEKQIELLQEQIYTLNVKYEKEQNSLHSLYKEKISELESQLQKQRDRTLALLDEKEQEVSTLKSSFQMFLPGNKTDSETNQRQNYGGKHSQLNSVLDANSDSSSNESPHILHYAHELARRDVNVTNLRKVCNQLESVLHQTSKEYVLFREKSSEEVTKLKEDISRLQRCQTREGANLEYLKNVMVNYLMTQSMSSKRHMFNAIATVLKFSESEIEAIRKKF